MTNSEQQQELDKWADTVADAVVESRLRRNYLSRLVRWILTLGFAVLIAVLVTDVRVVDAEREGCERRQEIFKAVDDILVASVEAQNHVVEAQTNPQNKKKEEDDLAVLVRNQNKIQRNIVPDCNAAYPHIFPGTDWID